MWNLVRVLRGELGDRVGELVPWVASMCLDVSPVHSGETVPTLKNLGKTAHQGAMVWKLFCAVIAARQVAGIQRIKMKVKMNIRSSKVRPPVVAELKCPEKSPDDCSVFTCSCVSFWCDHFAEGSSVCQTLAILSKQNDACTYSSVWNFRSIGVEMEGKGNLFWSRNEFRECVVSDLWPISCAKTMAPLSLCEVTPQKKNSFLGIKRQNLVACAQKKP